MRSIAHLSRLARIGIGFLACMGNHSTGAESGTGVKLWDYDTRARVSSSPALAPDGTVLVGAGNSLLAINPDKSLKWRFDTQGAIHSSPAVDQHGQVFFGALDRKIYALTPKGALAWTNGPYVTGGPVYSSPAIDEQGTIYVGSDDYKVYAIAANGELKWVFATGGYVRSSPSLGHNGVLYAGSFDTHLHALTTSGKEIWSFPTGHYVYSSAAIATDGTVYVGSVDKKLYALEPETGAVKWSYQTGSHIYASPAIGPDNSIYIGSWDDRLYALSPEGKLKWTFPTGNLVQSSPAVGSDGTVYFGSDENKIYAVAPNGAKVWAFVTGSLVRSSPVLASYGTLYCGSEDGRLYAIKAPGGPAVGSWPMFRGSADRRGRVMLVITNEPKSQTVTVGHPVSFSVGASGALPLHYQWLINGTNFPGPQTSTLTLSSTQPFHGGSVVAVVSNTLETVRSEQATLTVVVPPEITQQPETQTVNVGQSATLRVAVNSAEPPRFAWQFQGNPLPGETNAALALANLAIAQAGDYAVAIANSAGARTSAVAHLSVVAPPEITDQPQNQVGATGSSISFAVGARTTAPLSYQWRLNGTDLPGATGPLLEVKNVQRTNAGSYSVVVGNRAGTVASAAALLTVTLPPEITTQPISQTGVVNRPLTLGVVATSAGPLSYQWYWGSSVLTGAVANTLAFPKPQLSNGGVYSVVVSNVAGVVTSSSARLTFLVPPSITLQPLSQTGAFGGSITLRAAASGTPPLSYNWRWSGAGESALLDATHPELRLTALVPAQSGTYSLIVSNAAGAVTSNPALLLVPRPKTLWERVKGLFQAAN